ncbi:unnamed protein product [Mytilus edulis]|uniref:Uncharacterized protein n=1 Tax=Mytilus edulis TaxID=6550 RepID=A0A8S3QYT5_MYTED|nr:unnamed protein product [Mytilus edulis]
MAEKAKRPRKSCPKCYTVFSDRHARRHLLECNDNENIPLSKDEDIESYFDRSEDNLTDSYSSDNYSDVEFDIECHESIGVDQEYNSESDISQITYWFKMGKSKAEIQKAYRERKKQKEGEAYLKKERERVKGYYVPIEEKPQRKANERRKKVREWQTKTVANNLEQCSEISSSSDVTSTVNIVTEQLIVKLPSLATKKRTRTRVNRANAKHRRTIADLTDKNELLNRKIRTVSKRYQRLINREKKTQTIIRNPTTSSSSRNSPSTSTSIALTPRKRTIQEIREEGLTPHKVPKKIQEKLLFANVITEEIGAAWKSNGLKGKHVLKKIVNGEIIKKYKMKKMLGIKSGIRRHHFKATVCSNKLLSFPLLRKRVESREILRGDVVTFLERDDNSRMMPGKNDKKKTETGHIQKRVLNDSMLFLHLKFKTESPKKISLATFCRFV